MITNAILRLINVLHLLFVSFVLITPITNCNYFLSLHVIVIPFLVLHWVLNNNMCAISVIEKELRKTIYGQSADLNDCLTCKLIEPVYDFKGNNERMSNVIYTIVWLVWTISLSKLIMKCYVGDIRDYMGFFEM